MLKLIFNNQIIPGDMPCIPSNDRGFTLGHGFFETIFINKNHYPALDFHWKRMEASAPLLGITLPFSHLELESMLNILIIDNKLQDSLAGARLTVTHGEADRGLLPIQSPKPNFLLSVFECPIPNNHPCSALIVKTRKNENSLSSRVKSLSYMDNIFAKQEARDQGFDEAILLNTTLHVADSSMSNLFMVKDNKIITPPIQDGALPGVVRAMLLEEMGSEIHEQSIECDELLLADEIFLTNALMGVKSVAKLNHKEFALFPKADRLRKLLREKWHYI